MNIDADNPLAAEIRQEMATSYFAACRKMVDALEGLKVFDAEGGAGAAMEPERMKRRMELVAEARERVYFVVIQREAMNLPVFDGFFEDYEISEEVRTRMGMRKS